MRDFLLTMMLTLLSLAAVGQAAAPAQTPAAPAPLPFAQQIRKSVAFLQLVCGRGGELFDVRGTGFFVSYADERLGKDQGFIYLITNRHLAECWDDDGRPMEVKSIKIRMNTKDGSSVLTPINENGTAPWIFPRDESVDLAVLPFLPDEKTIAYRTVPTSMFATVGLTEGANIMFTGFFYQFAGERKMQPIIREGILAMMPDEDLLTTTGKPGKLYLGDVHIFGGNSGSPVFSNLGGVHGSEIFLERYQFVGVVSGYFYEDEEFQLRVATTLKGKAKANSGIAMIVPARLLKDLLDDPRAQQVRDAIVSMRRR